MCNEFEVVQPRIVHFVFIMAGKTFLDLHTFHILIFFTIARPGMMAFAAIKGFLMLFVREFGRFYCSGGF